ncbi:MAG: restriction endonuclease [Giesbergeria sp.]|uniref:restriction endonuclease n=1 Tax=Giesbergeria sp. TaxID=2818473 RepID=UPI00260567B1|nr:restriction endonuclease [Giesbergeria sp.]MDD2609961.1 restriction endonuclease [Giesbergeria sp.]
MARRKQEDPTTWGELQAITRSAIGVAAWLPWWLGVLLALAFYIGLHYIASQPQPDVHSLASLYQHAGALLARGLATLGQYLLPALCLAGAWLAWREQRKRAELLQQVTANPAADALDDITWQEFEVLVGEVFRRLGYQVEETGGGGADGGIDLILRRNGEKFLVQCKQWKAFRVSVEVVREMFGLMTAKGADGGFVVTSGRFTKPAIEFAQGRNLSLIDGPALLQWLHQTQAKEIFRQRPAQTVPVAQTPPAAVPTPPRRAAAPSTTPAATTPVPPASVALPTRRPAPAAPERTAPQRPSQPPRAPAAAQGAPTCPVCAAPMLLRLARKGPQAGQRFWGCVHYPDCNGTRQG